MINWCTGEQQLFYNPNCNYNTTARASLQGCTLFAYTVDTRCLDLAYLE